MKSWLWVVSIALAGPALQAADVTGTILIKRKLTKRSVTVASSTYHRGVAAELRPDSGGDPLEFERSRVVVYVDGPGPAKAVTALMEQKGRRFLPDTLAVPVGSTVSFPNLDPIFHNVFSLSKAKSFDLGNYPQNATRTVTFAKPGVVFVHCHLHPNMGAAIVVTPNDWVTKVTPQGQFSLRNLPAGTHTIVAWHKAAGFFRKTVRIAEGADAAIEFLIPLEESSIARVGN